MINAVAAAIHDEAFWRILAKGSRLECGPPTVHISCGAMAPSFSVHSVQRDARRAHTLSPSPALGCQRQGPVGFTSAVTYCRAKAQMAKGLGRLVVALRLFAEARMCTTRRH